MNTRTFIRASALGTALWVCSIGSAAGQMTVEAEAGPFVGGMMFLSSSPGDLRISRQGAAPVIVQDGRFENGIAVGVHAGVRFAERFGVDGTYAWIPTRLSARQGLEPHGGAVDANAIRYGVMTSYHFPQQGRFQPFVGVGVSGETVSYSPHLSWERDTSVAGTVGVGGSWWLSDGLLLRLDARRDVLTRSGERPANQLAVTMGVIARQRVR